LKIIFIITTRMAADSTDW